MNTSCLTALCAFALLYTLTTPLQAQQQVNPRYSVNSSINTTQCESNPVLSPDGRTMYFSRSNGIYVGSIEKQSIWCTVWDRCGGWMQPKEVKALNYWIDNELLEISRDGKVFYLLGGYDKKTRKGKEGIAVVRRTASGFTKPQYLNFRKDPESWHQCSITFNPDYTVMILSLNGNLYISRLGTDSIWSEPAAITGLNTTYYEYTPWLSYDGTTLYFSTDRKGTIGKADIVKCTRLDDSWMNWSEPVNLGSPVNSAAWESYYRISPSGNVAYLLVNNNDSRSADLATVMVTPDVRSPQVSREQLLPIQPIVEPAQTGATNVIPQTDSVQIEIPPVNYCEPVEPEPKQPNPSVPDIGNNTAPDTTEDSTGTRTIR